MASDRKSAATKIFVGGLSFSTTDGTLRSFFSKFGEVLEAIVMKDATTKRSRGFGFVVFSHPSSVDKVLADKDLRVDNRKVDAKLAVPRGDEEDGGAPDSPPRPLQRPTPRGTSPGGHKIPASVPAVGAGVSRGGPVALQPPSTIHGTASSMSARKIFAGGLHYGTDEDGLRRYFSVYGRISAAQVMYNRETCKSRGFGFVIFEDEASVDRVLVNRLHVIDEKTVEVKRAVPKSEDGTEFPLASPVVAAPTAAPSPPRAVTVATGTPTPTAVKPGGSLASPRPPEGEKPKPNAAAPPKQPAWGPRGSTLLDKLRQQDPIPEDAPHVPATTPVVKTPTPGRGTPVAMPGGGAKGSGGGGAMPPSVKPTASTGPAQPTPVRVGGPPGGNAWAVKATPAAVAPAPAPTTHPDATVAVTTTSTVAPASITIPTGGSTPTGVDTPSVAQPTPTFPSRRHSRSNSIVLSSCAASVGSHDLDLDGFSSVRDDGYTGTETDDFADNPFAMDDFDVHSRVDSAIGSLDDEVLTDDRRSRSGSDALSSVSGAVGYPAGFRQGPLEGTLRPVGGGARPPPSPIVRKLSTDASVSSRLSFGSSLGPAMSAAPLSPYPSPTEGGLQHASAAPGDGDALNPFGFTLPGLCTPGRSGSMDASSVSVVPGTPGSFLFGPLDGDSLSESLKDIDVGLSVGGGGGDHVYGSSNTNASLFGAHGGSDTAGPTTLSVPTQDDLEQFDMAQALASGLMNQDDADKASGFASYQFDSSVSYSSSVGVGVGGSDAPSVGGDGADTPSTPASGSSLGTRRFVLAPEFVPQSRQREAEGEEGEEGTKSTRKQLNPHAGVWSSTRGHTQPDDPGTTAINPGHMYPPHMMYQPYGPVMGDMGGMYMPMHHHHPHGGMLYSTAATPGSDMGGGGGGWFPPHGVRMAMMGGGMYYGDHFRPQPLWMPGHPSPDDHSAFRAGGGGGAGQTRIG